MEWGDQEIKNLKHRHHKYPSRSVKGDFGDMKRKLTVAMKSQVDTLHMKNIKLEIKVL